MVISPSLGLHGINEMDPSDAVMGVASNFTLSI